MKIGIVGAGTMGHVVKQYIAEMKEQGKDVCCLGTAELIGGRTLEEAFPETPEVLVDFSHPANIEKICAYAETHKIPAVIATTGCGEPEEERIRRAGQQVPIVFSANYSLGITVLDQLVEEMAAVLGSSFDIEIIEKHHRRKKDAPSGTALLLARAVQRGGKKGSGTDYEFTYGRCGSALREKQEIGIHAVRGGGIVGEHTVLFVGDEEVIEIKHHAQSKRIFAAGAVRAALFAAEQKPGIYSMKDVLWTQE